MTANKALLATHGAELAEIAGRRSAALLGSASVGGGTPMIETTEHMASTGEIARLRGVVNATTTYILVGDGPGPELRRGARRGPGSRLRRGGSELRRRRPRRGPEAGHPRVGGLGPMAPGDGRHDRGHRRPACRGGRRRSTRGRWDPRRADRRGRRSSTSSIRWRSTEGVESFLEIAMRDGPTIRVSGPGAGGPVTAGAVYADLARS